MTLGRPEGVTLIDWLRKDIGPKSLLLGILALVGLYYQATTRITIVEAARPEYVRQFDEITKRQDSQRDLLTKKVDKDVYEADQERQSERYEAIQRSLTAIQNVLMTQSHR